MRKKQFLQFRRAMATLLAVAMIGQNTVMTTAENYVADNTAVVAEEQAQEPEVQVEESASPAVQESAPAAETPAESVAQAVAETPAEPAAQAVAETPAEPAAQAVAETPAEPAAQAVAETPAEPAAQEVVETPAEPAGQTVAKTPETPAEQEPSVSAETSSGSASQEPAADADKASAAEAEIDGNTVPAENPSPELGKEVLYRITFNGDAAAHGTIQVKGETAPVDVASYNKEVKENEKFEFSITAAQGYETERVTLEADGTQLVKNAEGFYEIPAVTKAENILVTYKEIPQEPAANTGSTEESEEEPAEEPIEENTDELEMPVFDYSGSCAGVTAAIYAEEGVLPEGTTVELAPLSDAQIAAAVSVLGCEVSDILGLDITFIYNGEEIQPSGNVAVSFTAAEIADVDVTSVYHVGDDGAVNEVAASQEGSSLGFTTDSFSGYLVNLAGLNGQPSETAITGNTTVAVGETITLTGSRNTNCSYEQKWESTDSSKAVIFKAKGNSAEVTGIEEGKVTITHTYCSKWKKNHWPHQENSESIEVTVTAPVYATELSLPETVSVERGSTVTITPISLKPENATLTWKSDNSAVATVDSKGIVTGKKPGTATISAQSGDRIATTTVTVKAISGGSDNTGKSWSDVEFYYLKTPTSDKNSNSVDQWGSCLGIGSIDLTGATWDANNKNTFDNVPARVITWPSGGTGSTYTVTKNSAAWKEILKYWKTQIQNNLEVEITDDDIESITLTPYKISRNEKYHVDCTIDIKCKRVVTAKYFLWDAGTNVTQYDQVYAKSFVINKGTTQPSDSDKLSLPLAKTVDGKNYTLKAWYSNSSLQGETVTFPYSIGESNVNFYAKYVRSDIKYTVNYYWNGTTEKVADSVTGFGGEPGNVITETPKMINGYTPVSYEKKQLVISENGTNEINFYYFKNVELTANSATATYDGKEHSVSGYTGVPEGVSFAGITVGATGTNAGEYPAAFAKGTVGMTDGTGKYIVSKAIDGKLEIGKAAVTLKSATLSKKYDGNALVNGDTALEIESGFAEGEGATYNFTGSQTVVGSSANAFSYELNGNTNIDNYEISKQEGTLTVTNREAKYEITVKANSATATYDGKEHEAVGVETYEFTVEGNSYTVSGLSTEDPKQKDAGSYTNNITGTPVVTDKEGNVVTSEFEVKTENGSLTITPRQVNLTSESASKPYDGTPLTRPSVTGGDGFVAGEVTDIRATGSVTNVSEGEVTNAITYATGEKFNADNYNITREEGRLSITASQEKVTVTITGHTNTEKYDGTPKKAEGYEVAIASDSGLYKEADFSFSGTAEVEKTDAAETAYPMGLAAGQFTNTNTNFANVEFVVTDGALTITPRQVILTSATDEKVYDGTPLTNHNVTVSGDGFAAGEGATYDVTGTQTDKGSSDNTFTYKLNENTKASNYSIELAPGELTVTPVTDKVIVTITEHSASLKYNGAEQSVTGYDTAIDNTLYKETDFTFSGDATAKGTDFGSYPMNLKAEDFTNKNKNFANVVFEIVDGQLEITKRDVELISGSDEKVYDGTPLTKNHILIAGDQFVPGEGADYDVTGSQTNAGSSDNEFTYRLNSSTKAINYNIKTTPGTLKVTPVTDNVIVTITEHSGSAKYDGTEKTVTGYDVAIDNELYTENDFTFRGNDVIKATDADIYNMELKPSDFNNISHNFASVTFKIVDGTLNISRRDVTLTSATDSKTYDGKPLTNDNVAVGGDGFAEGEGAVYNVTGSQTEAGFSNNTFSYELKDNTKPDNYNITPFEGILTVSSSEDEVVVTITGNKGTQKYDGTEKTVEGYTVSITSPLYKESDFNFDGIALVKGTNADTYMMGLSEENFTNTNKNFAKVTFHVIDGSLVIEKRNLVLTSASAQKVYNGTELTAKDVTVSGDGFVKGEGASYDVTGTQTTVGDSENTFTYKLNENTNADNYTIETKNGSLLVTPVTDQVVVTLKENSGTEVYDGTEKTVTGYTVADISNKLYTDKDFTFTGNAEVKGTDAGIYDMELKAEDFQNINPNFTNVVFKVEDGALEITRRQVTFQADSGEKKYDGEELTVPTWKLADGTLADGQQEIAHVEGSQTLVGESENKITDLKIFANAASQEAEGSETEAQDVTKNYSIILLAGLLKVTDGSEEDPVDPGQVVTKTHEDKTYDLDENVTFTINVKNIYDEAKTVRIIELPGVVIEGAPQETPNVLTVEKVPAGETVTATATYKITEADIANGSFVNTVKVEFEGGKPFENTDTVTTVDPVRSYTLTKKSSESIHENGMFKAGETIHYTLTVTNTGNQTLENVEITDTLNAAGTISNIQGADSKQDGKVTIFTISSLAPKAEATITYDYMVQEADKGNTISNAAVGTPANPEDPDGEKPGDNTDNPVENPKLEVKKDIVSITAADGTQKDKAGKADLNDIITYSVTVTNTGNVKLTNVKITDSLEGIQLAEGQSFDLGILEAGKAKTVTYTYQVKESDLGKSILNTATATGDVPENPADTPKPEGKDEKEVPTEDPANCSITVTKRLTNIQGELLAVRAADFYVTLFSDEAMTQKAADTKMIHFDENQGTSSVTFDQLKRGTYYVAETDAEGKVVAEGTYNNGSYVAQYQAGNKVEITENGTAAQFQFDNQFLLLPDEYYIVKTITINKTVVKKNGEDLKSEETFYAGIFKDEDCTQLADGVSQNIVPLVMDGESTATAKTEVTVPVGGEEIKLYVTEVTADGTPVALNDTFEYDVEINDGFVTLSETSEDATVLIINTSRKEEPEPTAEPAQEPTEAPAEPTQAPQITQQPEDRAVTTNGVKTGDDSPLTQLAFMLFAASAAILLIIFLKKKDEKDIMK